MNIKSVLLLLSAILFFTSLNSKYYYLKNNDQIYVQPDKTKYATVDRGYRTTTLILLGLSIIAMVLSNLYR